MNILRKIGIFLLAALLFAAPALALSMEPGTGDAFYVQDTANVLSTATQQQIVSYNAVLENSCDEAQIVVVTVNYLDEDTEIASLQLMNDWGVGSASESNGMLLLLVANEKRGWLATGDGIDGAFTDETANKYLDKYFWDYIDNNEFDEGVLKLTEALYEWYLDYYGVETGNGSPNADEEGDSDMEALLGLIVLIAIIFAISRGVRGCRRRRGPRPPMGGPRPPMDAPRPPMDGPRPPMGGSPRPPMGGSPRPPMGGSPRPPMGGSRPGGFGGSSHGSGFGGHGGGGGGGRSGGSFGGSSRSGGSFGGSSRSGSSFGGGSRSSGGSRGGGGFGGHGGGGGGGRH